MKKTRYCACGCGKEVNTWKNGRESSFLRGHHMRKKGWTPADPKEKHYCKCGCGTEIKPLPSGHVNQYIKGHHLKGVKLSLEYRIERTKNRWGREPTLSPYLEGVFVSYDKRMGRWVACTRLPNGKSKICTHAKAVYQEHFGEVSKGYVVHHKDGKHNRLTDDRPDNLMLLLDDWNLRFFPVLAKGFGIPEKEITDTYLSIDTNDKDDNKVFSELCELLIEQSQEAI